ncbi:MAG: hypothetical protein ABIQ93_06275 [Saprospiraceae bacterium]
MQKKMFLAATCCLLFAGSTLLPGQTTTLSSQDMLAVFALQFDLFLPDTTFIEMEPGTVWEEAATEAKIMCNAMPATFERVLQDTTEIASSPEMILLRKGRLDLNGVPGYLIYMEFVQPEGSGSAEPFEGLMYVRPLDAQTALTVNVAYPKSQHNRLYNKMLAAFGSVQQRKVAKGR